MARPVSLSSSTFWLLRSLEEHKAAQVRMMEEMLVWAGVPMPGALGDDEDDDGGGSDDAGGD